MNEPPPSIDTSLIEHMLTLSYEERINAHEAARQLVNDLKQAGQDYYARQSNGFTSMTP
ncbi:MAG: hypothetical protein NTV34_21590 [Proteobacteria bacterium]|nr:hypothetical protein [Pseudomonadota bacterium]